MRVRVIDTPDLARVATGGGSGPSGAQAAPAQLQLPLLRGEGPGRVPPGAGNRTHEGAAPQPDDPGQDRAPPPLDEKRSTFLRRFDDVQLELISNFEMTCECCGGRIEMRSRGL
jgi:hypothetical protein